MAAKRAGGGRMPERPPRGTNPGKLSRIDTSTAHSARIYNYWLGGKDNFPADREAAQAAMAANPAIVADVRANRAFLARAVRYLVAEAGCSAAPPRAPPPSSTRTCGNRNSSSNPLPAPWTWASRSP
jgi:S-adenosyl methyltransferase